MMPVVLQKSIWFAKYRHPPFWAGSAAPRHFGESTIASGFPADPRKSQAQACTEHLALHLQRADRADYSQ